ncbi:MAG: Gfo/Idh/MocA family oxidoreductase [Pseudomonadota bacterium]
MTAARPLRVLLVGAGYFAKFHLEGWRDIAETEPVGLCDLDAARARMLAADVCGPDHGMTIGADVASLIAETQPDIVDIAAPPAAHLAMIEAAYAAPTTRAVICQKPFCGGLEGGRQAAALATADGRPLVVHENFRFQPWYREIRTLIAQGLVGPLYQLSFTLRPGDGQGPEAYLSRQPYFQQMTRFLVHETAVHWIDTFRFLLGEPDGVFADLRRLNPVIAGEDAGLILFSYGDGRRALFDGNRLADHPARNTRLTMGEARIEGAQGALFLDGDGELWHRETGKTWVKRETDYPKSGFGGNCVEALQAHVVKHLCHAKPLENEASDYLRVQEIENAIYRSAAEGRKVYV